MFGSQNRIKRVLLSFRLTASILLLAALSGCASTSLSIQESEDTNRDWHTLYLRGVFTWWEAEESFRFKKVSTNLYVAKANLVADGQPYDFKIADKDWSPGLSCGYLIKESDEKLSLGTTSKADCDTPVNNFKFTPDSTGEYLFYFKPQGSKPPLVYVEKGSE